MARRSQCSSAGDNPLDPNYLPPHYREEYRLAIDALVEEDLEGYYRFLQKADVVDFLSTPEIQHIQSSIHVPQQGSQPEHHFLEIGADGSSDTYWPLHSDLDAPGLDLGWPQMHQMHFMGPTEVTTLVNPPEPDMPSIKDQARRLIKNAQQVIAIAMDMFTDVDMFADVLNAAMRNVAVYIILDEQNAHHFIDMVANCRVNLQSLQFLRVRTVPGITYQCCTGKSFKGQMMDRFLLTDCRAVLSGNYSFMWSYEKLHRCMAHLFLGQLVTTFDEEFRILYAQSQPLIINNMPGGPIEELSHPQKRQYPTDRLMMYREQKTYLDPGHPEQWARNPHDERVEGDWRMMPLKKQEHMRGPADIYKRLPFQQSRMDPSTENPALKRHSYAEGISGRYSYPFRQQQGIQEPESQRGQFQRGQQPYPGPGREADYSGYEKFWNQDYLSTEQYPEPGPPLEMESPDSFDPVLNYLSSTGAKDFDEGSERSHPAGDLPFSSLHPRRQSLGQSYACQTSPTPSNTDQKQFFQEPVGDRKDPAVKRGLRNWRISSYLSAYDNSGDEGLPMAPPQGADPFEEPFVPPQQTATGTDFSIPKIPNVREFKVPAVPRVSQMPSYAKVMTRDPPKKPIEEPVAVVPEASTTPTPSDSSSTTEGEKLDEVELKEPKTSVLRREESFRRKYNAAQPRSSRLRSSLIFTSLDQQNTPQETKTTGQDQQDEESDKNETEQTKLPFLSHLLSQRRSSAREPVEWSRFMKSATFDHSSTEEVKTGDSDSKTEEGKDNTNPTKEENPQALSENLKADGSSELSNIVETNQSPSEQPKSDQPPKALFLPPLDMSDPDNRLMFFKELAAKRKAEKAAEAEKSKEKPPAKQPTDPTSQTAVKKEEPAPKDSTESLVSTSDVSLGEKSAADNSEGKASTEAVKSIPLSLDASEKKNKQGSLFKNDSNTSQTYKAEQTKVPADSKSTEMEKRQTAVSLPEKEAHQSSSLEQTNLSKSAVKESKPLESPITISTIPVTVSPVAQDTVESESQSLDSTSKECNSATPSSVEGSASSVMESNSKHPESLQSTTNLSPFPPPSEENTESIPSSSDPSGQSSSSDHTSSTPSTTGEAASSNITPKGSSSPLASSVALLNSGIRKTQESVSPSLQESSQSDKETLENPKKQMIQPCPDNSSQTTSSETSPAPEPASDPKVSSQSTPATMPEEVSSVLNPTQETNKDVTEKDVIETTKQKLEPENNVSSPEQEKSDSSKNISQPEKIVSESEEVSNSDKDICDTDRNTSESENNVAQQSGNSLPGSDNLPGSEKTAFDSAKDLSELAKDVSVSKDASNSDSNKKVSEPEPPPFPKSVPDDSTILGSSKDVKSDNMSSTLSPSMPDSSLLTVKSSATKPDLKETSTPPPTQSDTTPQLSPPETNSSVKTDSTSNVSQSETSPPTQDKPTQATPPSNVKEVNEPNPTEAPPSSESDGSGVSPEAKVTETYMCLLLSVPDTKALTSVSPTESNKNPKQPSIKSPSSPTEPPSEVLKEINPPCQTPESGITEIQTSEQTVHSENGKTEIVETEEEKSEDTKKIHDGTTQESVSDENTTNQVKQMNNSEPAEITSKQPKSNQSRYHSSTANVLSSSNLRDDTKLLLGQISANSQTRNETTKEPPVTDDEKEDKADKNAKREQEKGIRKLNRESSKAGPEREKLLEKIQVMRKERKVYSRFEV